MGRCRDLLVEGLGPPERRGSCPLGDQPSRPEEGIIVLGQTPSLQETLEHLLLVDMDDGFGFGRPSSS